MWARDCQTAARRGMKLTNSSTRFWAGVSVGTGYKCVCNAGYYESAPAREGDGTCGDVANVFILLAVVFPRPQFVAACKHAARIPVQAVDMVRCARIPRVLFF